MSNEVLMWIGFNVFVLLMLALDLGIFHKKSHSVGMKEALIWSGVWITLAMVFNIGVYHYMGSEAAMQFLTGYVIEKSLSVDNIFVFVLIFSYFAVPAEYQHKVLFWGIIGALIMRAILIAVGAALISEFHWIIYIFGGFLIITGIKMLVQKEMEIHPESNPVVRFFKKFMSVTPSFEGDRFFVKKDAKTWATPLFVVLLIVEFTDLIFAVDSIPAIFAITTDPFIVYTSNVFAILGLRSLYFALASVIEKFHLLKLGLALVLIFVGVKMTIVDFYKIPVVIALAVVASILSVSVILSLLIPAKSKTEKS
ncbi:TerC family protein [bacterium]|nr:TerC family protein [bacterium]NUN45788.1 TerC family protein [bacterium]HMW34638.1 TerC family protein [bacterium]HMW37514.1 TerC family protein [bacterium]HMZ03288.1 TerC family protein [bacterium]